ncbi:SPOR domain-containing protein [Temperatibacter marinus]|uniref:SPOR domain-containing protein n=1 Tax=Temperatibacter marinus TaxID=1456591 RepID=A0AA52HAD6_9PROT|nr:SPOR domain-containing protein [Temperatibacter marinus]WND02630.1 SPOR domain-containing protein [Temperatibacter marinus]
MTEEDNKADLDPRDTPPWLMPVSEEDAGAGNQGIASYTKWIALGATAFVVLSVFGLVYLYNSYVGSDGPVKHVKADPGPVKERPLDAGGKNIPDQDKKVFDKMQGRDEQSAVVDISKQPEEPVKEMPKNQVEETPVDNRSSVEKKPEDNSKERAKTETPAPKPVSQKPAKPTVSKASQPKATPGKAVAGYDFYRVQLGSFLTENTAKSAWRSVRRDHSQQTGDMKDYITTAVVGGTTYYRLTVGPLDNRMAADNLCLYFKTRGQPCFVVSPSKK